MHHICFMLLRPFLPAYVPVLLSERSYLYLEGSVPHVTSLTPLARPSGRRSQFLTILPVPLYTFTGFQYGHGL